MSVAPVLVAEGLVKRYPVFRGFRDLVLHPFDRRAVTALDGLDLEVGRGRVFCLLGPNGAGKTTLIKVLATLVLPDGGRASVAGHDVALEPGPAKRAVGYAVSDERSFYWRLTGRQNLEFFGALYGLGGPARDRRIGELLRLAGLEEAADLRFNGYSTGMRQMLAFARALLADAAILLVDEPTRSLDPQAADRVRAVPSGGARRAAGQDRPLGHPRPRRGRRLRRRHRRHQPGPHPPPRPGGFSRRRRAGLSPAGSTRRPSASRRRSRERRRAVESVSGAAVMAAFLRRDFREALTYKFSFVSSVTGILLSSATFYFVAKLVPPGTPSLGPFGGDYFSFAVVGVAFAGLLGMFQEGLAAVVRSAQLSGTLEALLVTPVPVPVILFGSSLYSLLFQVVRTALHLGVALAFFGLALGPRQRGRASSRSAL